MTTTIRLIFEDGKIKNIDTYDWLIWPHVGLSIIYLKKKYIISSIEVQICTYKPTFDVFVKEDKLSELIKLEKEKTEIEQRLKELENLIAAAKNDPPTPPPLCSNSA